MIVIEFSANTKSKSFNDALYLGSFLHSFDEYVDGKKLKFRAKLRRKDIAYALPFIRAIRGIRSKRIIVDGEERDWKGAFGFLECYIERSKYKDKRGYCFGDWQNGISNLFRCRKAEDVLYESMGRFDSKRRKWIFNKKQIARAVDEATASCSHCPALQRNFTQGIVAALPTQVDPLKENADFEFIEPMVVFPDEQVAYEVRDRDARGKERIRLITGVRIARQEVFDKMSQKVGRTVRSDVMYQCICRGSL